MEVELSALELRLIEVGAATEAEVRAVHLKPVKVVRKSSRMVATEVRQ